MGAWLRIPRLRHLVVTGAACATASAASAAATAAAIAGATAAATVADAAHGLHLRLGGHGLRQRR